MSSPLQHISIDAEGLRRLRRPLLPLARMVHFFLATGAADSATEVLGELPSPIETAHAVYENPQELLTPLLPLLNELTSDLTPTARVIGENGVELDPAAARTALIWQRLLEIELEGINSRLCAPCGCTLCCTGPDAGMAQEAFFIPLRDDELRLFPLPREKAGQEHDQKPHRSTAEWPDFHGVSPSLLHWRQQWFLALPRGTRCPLLHEGRCRQYAQRPQVCRRPQIFPYLLESLPPADDGSAVSRERQGLRAVSDCPYVAALREEIADYAAACELTVYFGPNKG